MGDIVRKVIAETSLNDINTGSVLLTLLEACASVDFENNSAILNILELLSIDVIRNNDLDNRAADFGLTRKIAQKASGFITISDSTITKRSTGLYQVKPAPISGQTKIYVNDASTWNPTGTIYIGRGTPNFEGPINYTSIEDNGTFYGINLASALQRDHLISDIVVDAQNTTDRLIPASTVCKIPASSQNPEVKYIVLRNTILPAGEDTITNISVVAEIGGTTSNAGINTITQFASTPFNGATCVNTTAFTNGSNIESDDELRERIKSYGSTLARGTKAAILAAVIGVSDNTDGKQVASAFITEPPVIGDPSILYIDDGTGFQPSTEGQSVDILLSNASGNEEFLQLANYPLPRPEVTNVTDGPYTLIDGMILRVLVDGVEDTVIFSADSFVNITASSLAEIVVAINNQTSLFKARFTEDTTRLLLYPTAHNAETIQVVAVSSSDDLTLYANSILKFPTNEFSYIRLYKDSTLLTEKSSAASLITNTFSTWNITASGNIIISVDGTPAQNQTFTTTDFNGSAFVSLTISDWVTAFNNKFAGITAEATSSDELRLTSNKIGSNSYLSIVGGSYLDNWFANLDVEAAGTSSDFQLNRQNGNLRILSDINEGETITAGTSDARGNFTSNISPTGIYNLSVDSNNREAILIFNIDADNAANRGVTVTAGDSIVVQDMSGGVTRLISSSNNTFGVSQPGDFLYIANKGGLGASSEWIHPDNCGLHKIISKGDHIDIGVDTWIEYVQASFSGTNGSAHVVAASEDIQIFHTNEYPQIWRGSFLTTPAASSVQEISDSINEDIVNINSSVYKTSQVKVSSSTENGGSIQLPVSSANATVLFPTAQEQQVGNPSHIANKVTSKDVFTFFKRTTPTNENAGGVANKEVWLDRHTYGDNSALISTAAVPEDDYTAAYDEVISTHVYDHIILQPNDIVYFLSGNNERHFRSIKEIQALNTIGTQQALPRTLLDHVTTDRVGLTQSIQLHPEDSIVLIIDQDAVAKTIDIPFSRKGMVNTNTVVTGDVFSATDLDGEDGVGFDDTQVWGTDTNGTDFKDYALWMRARNWYMTGGAYAGNNTDALTSGSMIVRSYEYGPQGENLRLKLEYPGASGAESSVSHQNNGATSLTTYFFGSDTARVINTTSGSIVSITDVSDIVSYTGYTEGIMRYQFKTAGVDFSSVLIGDILGIGEECGFEYVNNTGAYRILGINDVDNNRWVDVYNPNAQPTQSGYKKRTSISLVAEGSAKEQTRITPIADVAGSLGGKYFVLYDDIGAVAFWYSHNGAAEPTNVEYTSAYRKIEIANVVNDYDAIQVGTVTYAAVSADIKFNSISFDSGSGIFVVQSSTYGIKTNGHDGITVPTGFSFTILVQGSDSVLEGEYFILYGNEGMNCFWINVSGAATQPAIGANKYIEIITINEEDNLLTVATKITTAIDSDTQFDANLIGTNVIVNDIDNGTRMDGSLSSNLLTAGATITILQNGSNDEVELILYPILATIYPLLNTTVAEIVEKINEGRLLRCTAIGDDSRIIAKATRDEVYAPAGPTDYSVSLGFGHNPNPGYKEKTSIVCIDEDAISTLTGKYFVLPDGPTTNVAFWYSHDGGSEPSHGADRSVEISTLLVGDDKYQVAQKTAIAINADDNFRCKNTDGFSEDTVIAINIEIGIHTESAGAGDTGFTVSQILAGTINPNNANSYVSLFDGINWIQSFQNADPNFTLKQSMILQNACHTSTYSIDNNPNDDITDLGEQFKLVPITPENIYHHFTQKALSQLPIVASVDYSDMKRRIQLKSQQLGSNGSIEVVGGNANDASFSVFGESQIVTENNIDHLAVQISAYPNTLTKGSLVELENDINTPRYSRLDVDSTIDVAVEAGTSNMWYEYNHKDISMPSHIRFTISDVSSDTQKEQTITAIADDSDSLNGGYWLLHSKDNIASFYIWYNTGTAVDPNPYDSYHSIEVSIATNDTAADVASKTRLALIDNYYFNLYFTESGTGNDIVVEDVSVGDALDAGDGGVPTNFNFAISIEGSSHGRNPTTIWRWRHSDTGAYVNIIDKNNGLVATRPTAKTSSGGDASTRLSVVDISAGVNYDAGPPEVLASPQQFRFIILNSSLLVQADFFYMQDATSGEDYAIWFNIDGDDTEPTNVLYTGADNKIEVSITSNDTEDEVTTKMKNALTAHISLPLFVLINEIAGADFSDVNVGDLLQVYETISNTFDQGSSSTQWNAGNICYDTGDKRVAGWPIVAVNANNRYIDVVNPFGEVMVNTTIGNGSIGVTSSPIIKWNLRHVAKVPVVSVDTNSKPSSIYVNTLTPHMLKTNDEFSILDNDSDTNETGLIVKEVISSTQFIYESVFPSNTATYTGGHIIKTTTNGVACANTKYSIEPLGYNNLARIRYISGQAPYFLDCGVAVDDMVMISGETFLNANRGTFRILGVDQDYIIVQNSETTKETNTWENFNNLSTAVTWTSSSNYIEGNVGDFNNISIGNWVKKTEDRDDYYVQVIGFLNSVGAATIDPTLAASVELVEAYRGTSASATGVLFDAVSDVNAGVMLRGLDDIAIYEGDSLQVGDNLFVDAISNSQWFSNVNIGTREIISFGTTDHTNKVYISVINNTGIAESDRSLALNSSGFLILEGRNNIFKSIRKVEHIVADDANINRKMVYLTPSNRSYKWSRVNGTTISSLGKMSYDVGITSGIDGYKYYTGLLRTVQRIVDGYEPDPVTYPGRRAIGGIVETLPPLINNITLSIDITTNEGINLNEISANIKSAIIDYVNNLGVGEDVILAKIIVKCMGITGVEAVTMNIPSPSNERIAISDNEKAYVEPGNISIA